MVWHRGAGALPRLRRRLGLRPALGERVGRAHLGVGLGLGVGVGLGLGLGVGVGVGVGVSVTA